MSKQVTPDTVSNLPTCRLCGFAGTMREVTDHLTRAHASETTPKTYRCQCGQTFKAGSWRQGLCSSRGHRFEVAE